MTHPDFRALCAELTDDLEKWVEGYLISNPADGCTAASFERIERARAALAEQQQGPSNKELLAALRHLYASQQAADMGAADDIRTARAVLALYGAHPAPVPVPERLPGEGDCDAEQFCWFWDYGWTRQQRGWHDDACTHWLPHWALPLPELQP
jgi:hypothetical protein